MCVFVCISTQCTHFHSKISTNARRLNALATRNKDNTLKHLLWFEYYAFFTNWSVIHRKATPIHTQLHAMQFLLQKSNTIGYFSRPSFYFLHRQYFVILSIFPPNKKFCAKVFHISSEITLALQWKPRLANRVTISWEIRMKQLKP